MALRPGLPMMILPVLYPFGDQMFWGKQVHREGLGVEPVPLSKLTPSRFGHSVRTLLEADFSSSCNRIKAALAVEDGLLEAIRIIKHSLRGRMLSD